MNHDERALHLFIVVNEREVCSKESALNEGCKESQADDGKISKFLEKLTLKVIVRPNHFAFGFLHVILRLGHFFAAIHFLGGLGGIHVASSRCGGGV